MNLGKDNTIEGTKANSVVYNAYQRRLYILPIMLFLLSSSFFSILFFISATRFIFLELLIINYVIIVILRQLQFVLYKQYMEKDLGKKFLMFRIDRKSRIHTLILDKIDIEKLKINIFGTFYMKKE